MRAISPEMTPPRRRPPRGREMKLILTMLALSFGTAASAATILETSGPGAGTRLALNLSDFSASGPCGDGISVVNDGCSSVIKGPGIARPSGRFDPTNPVGTWVDSSDLEHLTWNVKRRPEGEEAYLRGHRCVRSAGAAAGRARGQPLHRQRRWRSALDRRRAVARSQCALAVGDLRHAADGREHRFRHAAQRRLRGDGRHDLGGAPAGDGAAAAFRDRGAGRFA